MKKLCALLITLISTNLAAQYLGSIQINDPNETIEITFVPNLMTSRHSDIEMAVPSLTLIRGHNGWPQGTKKLLEPFNLQPFTSNSLDIVVRAGNVTRRFSPSKLEQSHNLTLVIRSGLINIV